LVGIRKHLRVSSVAEKAQCMREKDIPVIFPDGDVIVLDQYLGKGLQPNETEFPEDAPGE
jgi:hypothetical protein